MQRVTMASARAIRACNSFAGVYGLATTKQAVLLLSGTVRVLEGATCGLHAGESAGPLPYTAAFVKSSKLLSKRFDTGCVDYWYIWH